MNKEIIKQAIVEFQEGDLPRLIARDIDIPHDSGKIVTLIGVRRSGKTSLLFALMEKLIQSGISKECLAYINFDDPRFLAATGADLENILNAWYELFPDNKSKDCYLFLDEIQQVKAWELGVRRLYDTKKVHLFLTGSSSKLLSKDIATSLRGRSISFEILPFDVREYLSANGISLNSKTIYSKERFSAINHLEGYFAWGGFPEVVLQQDIGLKARILKEYTEAIFFKDLVERYKIQNHILMRELLRFLVTNSASLFSLNAFWKWIKQSQPVTKRTLINYVSYLDDSNIIFLVKKFSDSLKEQSLRPRKVYLVDNGLRTIYGLDNKADKGRVLENCVYLALRHLQAKCPLMQIFYWQDGKEKEVDFVVKDGAQIKALIQVCLDPQAFKTNEREIVPLVGAMREFKLKRSLVITGELEKEEKTPYGVIEYIPFWKWAAQGIYKNR